MSRSDAWWRAKPGTNFSDSLYVNVLLQDIADKAARPDGWISLSATGKLLRKFAPDEMATLSERYGHKSLKSLIMATELFDINEEPTEKGGIHVLYRLKPE